MKPLKYMYYRMYMAYEAKNDSPALRAFIYICLCVSSIAVNIFLYLEKILGYANVVTDRLLPDVDPLIMKIIYILIVLIYSFLVYSRRDIRYYENLFDDKEWLNTHIKIWMLILFPFVVLFGGTLLLVPLFGGEIMGNEVVGLFCK